MTDTAVDQLPTRSALRVRVAGGLARAGRRLLVLGQAARLDQMRALPPAPGAIVFLGDSITEQGLWTEWFPGNRILNRGIGGETTEQILRRLDLIEAPRAVFLLAGTNDLTLGRAPDAVADDLVRIADRLHDATPGVTVVVQSVMPRRRSFAREIARVNARLQAATAERAEWTRYLDLWPILATPDGELSGEYTVDLLHLNGAGYRAWADVLRPCLDELAR